VRTSLIAALILAPLSAAAQPGPRAAAQLGSVNIDCRGDGTPVVVLDPGLNKTAASWAKVIEPLSRLTRVCAYDRTNWAARGGRKRPTALSDASALHALLATKVDNPPYVLAGLSYGALIVREYAGTFPNQVAGLVLVDSPHEDYANKRAALRHQPPPNYPPEVNWVDWPTTFSQLRAIKTLGDLPLVVLSADRIFDGSDPELKLWLQLQKELAKLSTRGIQRTIPNVDYSIPIDAPQAVIRAVQEIVVATRVNLPGP
jgi:pimeloyl-ACP methyl ester carboxylesterase